MKIFLNRLTQSGYASKHIIPCFLSSARGLLLEGNPPFNPIMLDAIATLLLVIVVYHIDGFVIVTTGDLLFLCNSNSSKLFGDTMNTFAKLGQ